MQTYRHWESRILLFNGYQHKKRVSSCDQSLVVAVCMPTTEKFKLHNVYGCLINRKRRCHFKCILQELVNFRVVIHQCILIALEISIDFKIELL
jgi:hypothetical protein